MSETLPAPLSSALASETSPAIEAPRPHALRARVVQRAFLALVLLAAVAVPFFGSGYILSFSVQLLIFVSLAYSWNLIGGYAGYTHFGQMSFFGVGAYVGGLLMLNYGWHWSVAALAASVCGAVLALPLGFVMLRLRGPFFAIGMFGLTRVLESFAQGFDSVTHGGTGLYLPPLDDPRALYFVLAVLAVACVGGTWALDNSRLGLKLLALREDEDVAASLGLRTVRLKVLTFTASAVAPSALGALYAAYLGFIDPPSAFAANLELTTIAGVLVGGLGTVIGPLLGTLCLTIGNELLWAQYPQIYLATVGVVILACVLFAPRGLVAAAVRFGLLPPGRLRFRTLAAARRVGAAMSPQPQVAAHDAPGGAAPIIEVRGICKRYAGRTALDGVSLSVPRGRITGVIGPNGSGKSTLFSIIAGTVRADAGSVRIDGRDVSRDSPSAICAAGVGRTFQISRLFGEMSVLENLLAVARGLDDAAACAKAFEVMEFLEIVPIAHRWGSELSYGQRKLVEIARALMLDPRIMLLDEPFAGINPRLQNRIVDHVKALVARGVTVFFVDHEMRIVMGECDLVHVLAEGALVTSGAPAQVRNDPKVLEAYF